MTESINSEKYVFRFVYIPIVVNYRLGATPFEYDMFIGVLKLSVTNIFFWGGDIVN